MVPSSESQHSSNRISSAIGRLLTPRRLSYAWIVGAALWLAWLLSLLLGPGNLDLGGQPVGTDYLQFYAAGETLLQGASDRLYDVDFQIALEQEIIGPGLTSYHAFITPPFFAVLFAPLALLPYGWSFGLWSGVSLGLLVLSLRLLHPRRWRRISLWALTWFPVFATVSFGQNSLLSLGLLTGVFVLWRREKHFLAGLLASLVLYKPQLLLGVGVLWVLDLRRSWRALVGLGVGGLVLALFSFALLPDASRAYVGFATGVLPHLTEWQQFPIWHLHTIRGFWRLLLPGLPAVADGLTLLLAIGGLWGFVQFWRRYRGETDLLFAAAICLTLWLTPHAMIYDWTLLLIPAIVFWRDQPRLRPEMKILYAALWLVTLLSGPLTYYQLQGLPGALQISVPVLVLAFYIGWRQLVVSSVSAAT